MGMEREDGDGSGEPRHGRCPSMPSIVPNDGRPRPDRGRVETKPARGVRYRENKWSSSFPIFELLTYSRAHHLASAVLPSGKTDDTPKAGNPDPSITVVAGTTAVSNSTTRSAPPPPVVRLTSAHESACQQFQLLLQTRLQRRVRITSRPIPRCCQKEISLPLPLSLFFVPFSPSHHRQSQWHPELSLLEAAVRSPLSPDLT